MRIHLGPTDDPHLAAAITEAGGQLAPLDDADAVVWSGSADDFPALPDRIRWVQLAFAGIEPFFRAGVIDDRRVWTNASGVYSDNVAEYALGALLVGLRQFHTAIRVGAWRPDEVDPKVRTLHGSTVAIVGAGGIGRALVPRLRACGADVIAVNRSGRPVPGATETVPATRTGEVWGRADHVVIAAPSTDDTHHLVDADALAAMKDSAWLVNVARGTLVDTDALVEALRTNAIAGAVLDVTEPEPLPDDHPLWSLPNAVVTPHVANMRTTLTEVLAPTVAENVRRFADGADLISVVDPSAGY